MSENASLNTFPTMKNLEQKSQQHMSVLSRVVQSSEIGTQLEELERYTERCMVDTDNVLFQAKRTVENSATLPQGLFEKLELCLKQTKSSIDELEYRLDELGVTCGSATQAFSFKQRIDVVSQKLIGAMDSIQDFKDGQVMMSKKDAVKTVERSRPVTAQS